MPRYVSIAKVKHYWPLYGFVIPSALLVSVFSYYTATSAMYHAFFRWNGDYIKRFIGLGHFERSMGRPGLWLIVTASAFAITITSKNTSRWCKLLRALIGIGLPLTILTVLREKIAITEITASAPQAFVSALIFLAMVMTVGFLSDRYDPARPARMAFVAILGLGFSFARMAWPGDIAWAAALLVSGIALWLHPRPDRRLLLGQAFGAIAVAMWTLGARAGGDPVLWRGFSVIAILVLANIIKMIPSIATAVVIHRLKSDAANYWYRVLFVVPMIIPGMVYLLIWKFFFQPDGLLNLILNSTGIMWILSRLDSLFDWGGIFTAGGSPVWLGTPQLVLPAMILWGFPWVGVVGVLIYLAGLQSIDKSLYEAADVDGVGSIGKFIHLELPLILTQVRINLVLLIIGTLQTYGLVLILFGSEGGPQGRLLIPGLYMFHNAFARAEAGYACSIGLIIFVFILLLTEINNRFIKVNK